MTTTMTTPLCLSCNNEPNDDIPKKKKRICTTQGCTNKNVQGGKCISHEAKRKLVIKKICSTQGCTNQEVNGGICISHGARCKKKEDDEFISCMMKEINKSDWTDEEKVRMNKITKQRMINRRRNRRRDFIKAKKINLIR